MLQIADDMLHGCEHIGDEEPYPVRIDSMV